MDMRPLRLMVLTWMVFLLAAPTADAEESRRVDLRTLVRLAVENNLEIQAQTYETRAEDAVLRAAYGVYDPRAEAAWIEGRRREQLNLQFFDALSDSNYRRYDLSLTQKIPTGADLIAQWRGGRDQINSFPRPDINPAYAGELRFSLVQPLLRDFGRTVTEREILFAAKDREASVQNLRERAFEVIAEVRHAWFDALRLREDLEHRRASVALAERILQENQARVDAGVLPPIENLEAEVGLRQRERDLLDAQRAYLDSLDELALLINSPWPVEPIEMALGRPGVQYDEVSGYAAAVEKRPDLLRQLRRIERLEVESRVARNQTLPSVDVQASYARLSLEDEFTQSLDGLSSDDLENWEVGVRLSYPLGNRAARNAFQRVELLRKSEHARLAQLKDQARRDIRAALRLIDVSAKKIEASRSGRLLAEEKLRTLLKRKEVGLATTRDVLEGEDDLAAARFDETASLADYNKAITDYLRVSGLLLDAERIRFVAPVSAHSDRPLLGVDLP
ncbi:TolC family protein [Geoalkalibacter halelectricus]|nr:TolC family protein [Geoalkalibacter halelectricus]